MRKLYDAADRFCARHPRFGVPDLMRYIVIGNVVVFFLIMLTRGTNANALNFLYFDPQMVLRGEVWRIVTYIFVPSTTSVFWLVEIGFNDIARRVEDALCRVEVKYTPSLEDILEADRLARAAVLNR